MTHTTITPARARHRAARTNHRAAIGAAALGALIISGMASAAAAAADSGAAAPTHHGIHNPDIGTYHGPARGVHLPLPRPIFNGGGSWHAHPGTVSAPASTGTGGMASGGASSTPVTPSAVHPLVHPNTVGPLGLFGNGTAAHPNAGLLFGNGFDYDATSCTGGKTCNGGNAGLIAGDGGNGFNSGNGGNAGLFSGHGGNGGAADPTSSNKGGRGGNGALLTFGSTGGDGGAGGAGFGINPHGGAGGAGGNGSLLFGWGGKGGAPGLNAKAGHGGLGFLFGVNGKPGA